MVKVKSPCPPHFNKDCMSVRLLHLLRLCYKAVIFLGADLAGRSPEPRTTHSHHVVVYSVPAW